MMIGFFTGMFFVVLGSVTLYLGSMTMICSVLPAELSKSVGAAHGKWMRERVLGLEPLEKEKP